MMMDIKVPMSDGVTLSTNVYLPKNNIPCPVILQRSLLTEQIPKIWLRKP